MNVLSMPVGAIKPYDRNTKKHTAKQVEQIARSIQEFGFRQPLVVDSNNVLIIGHGRLAAAKRLGLHEVPVVIADERRNGIQDVRRYGAVCRGLPEYPELPTGL